MIETGIAPLVRQPPLNLCRCTLIVPLLVNRQPLVYYYATNFNSCDGASSGSNHYRACSNIHYWLSVKPGATQGKKAGELIIERILKK